jgi:hypothetical protein
MRKTAERVTPPKPEQREQYVAEVVCDLCGRTGGQLDTFDGAVEWQGVEPFRGEYNHVEVRVTLEESNRYPEGGSGAVSSFDCCPVCFREKIGGLFEAAGGEMYKKEIDY